MKALLENRTELTETRLEVTAVQIIERLRIRADNLKQLAKEETAFDNRLLQLSDLPCGRSRDIMGLESQLEQGNSQVRSAQRRENVECWRDLVHVMRDFLNAWEGLSRNEAKNRFLEALPDSNNNSGGYHPLPQTGYEVLK